MPLGTMTAPIFGHHAEAGAQRLPDVKTSDNRKALVLLRRLRAGPTKKLVVVPSTTNDSSLLQPQQEDLITAVAAVIEERSVTATPTPSEAASTTTPTAAPSANASAEDLPALPAYAARPAANEEPPPYAGQILPPTLPGYTALPLPGIPINQDPARDLKQPGALNNQRSRYRNVLRRRISATKRLFGNSSPETMTADQESARGVVLYRDGQDRWVGAGELDEIEEMKFMQQAKQKGLRGWLRRAWVAVKDFMEEHPMLFFVALFVIIVVALCILI